MCTFESRMFQWATYFRRCTKITEGSKCRLYVYFTVDNITAVAREDYQNILLLSIKNKIRLNFCRYTCTRTYMKCVAKTVDLLQFKLFLFRDWERSKASALLHCKYFQLAAVKFNGSRDASMAGINFRMKTSWRICQVNTLNKKIYKNNIENCSIFCLRYKEKSV